MCEPICVRNEGLFGDITGYDVAWREEGDVIAVHSNLLQIIGKPRPTETAVVLPAAGPVGWCPLNL